MSLFGETREERESELLNFMTDINNEIKSQASEKSQYYGFNFENENPYTDLSHRYQWESTTNSSFSKLITSKVSGTRSSVSTLASLQIDIDEIPEIADFDMRISIDIDLFKDH